jgi:hypothetical protein
MVDPNVEPDVELLTDAMTISKDDLEGRSRRPSVGVWASVEKDIGSFEDFGDVDLDEVTPLSLAVLRMCIDAYIDGLPAHG